MFIVWDGQLLLGPMTLSLDGRFALTDLTQEVADRRPVGDASTFVVALQDVELLEPDSATSGGIPRRGSPTRVPIISTRAATRSPSSMTSSTDALRSGRAARSAQHADDGLQVAGKLGASSSKSWRSTASGATDVVKSAYDSARRQQQARRHRARVLESARRRFLDQGYAATTLGAVAADADVSVDTIYKAFRNKAGVLKPVFDVAVAGDNEPVSVPDREFVAAIQKEPDGRSKLRLYAEHLSTSMPRAAPVQLLAQAAAASDPEIEVVHRQTRTELLTATEAFAAHLYGGGYIEPGMTVEQARDILWTVNSPELYELLVLERGWTVAR